MRAMPRLLRCALCLVLAAAAVCSAPSPNVTADAATHAALDAPDSSGAQDDVLPSGGNLESLLHWAIGTSAAAKNADPAELQRLAAAAETADASRELPAGGPGGAAARAWTAEELREKRAKVQEAMAYYKSLPTEAELVKLAAAALANGTDDTTREGALQSLLELVGPADVANDLQALGALAPLLDQLGAGSPRVRALAAHVAGAAAANNAHFQAQLVALGGVPLLLARAEHDEPEVRAKALYALSALARAPGLAQEAFLQGGGVAMLHRTLAGAAEPMRLRKKALLLITDLAATSVPGAEGRGEGLAAPAESSAPLLLALREPPLLRALASLLAPPEDAAPDDDLAEKVLRAMRVYLSAEVTPAREAAVAFRSGGADGALAALRVRLAAAVAAEAAEADADDEGSYLGDLALLCDHVAAALRAATPPGHDEL